MGPEELYSKMRKIIPFPEEEVFGWFPEGPNTMRIRLITGVDLRITLNDDMMEVNDIGGGQRKTEDKRKLYR